MKSAVKIIICGDGAVGKTSITNRLCYGNHLLDQVKMTPGIEINRFDFAKDEKEITGCIWDLGGQHQFRFIQDAFFKGAKIVIFTYSIEWYHSFRDIDDWIRMIPIDHKPDYMLLVANKIDSSKKVLITVDGEEYAEKHGMQFFEISAKTGQGFEEFKRAVENAIADCESNTKKKLKNDSNNLESPRILINTN